MLAAAAAGLAKTDRAQIVYGDDDAYAAHACSWYAMHVVQHTLHIPLDTRPVSCIAHCPLHTANCTWRRSAACRRMAHHANNRPQIYLSQNVCVVRATYIVHAGDGAAQMIKPIRICAVQANLINILTQVYAFACQLYIYISSGVWACNITMCTKYQAIGGGFVLSGSAAVVAATIHGYWHNTHITHTNSPECTDNGQKMLLEVRSGFAIGRLAFYGSCGCVYTSDACQTIDSHYISLLKCEQSRLLQNTHYIKLYSVDSIIKSNYDNVN